MEQAQSFYSVILKGHFNIYEMRILLKIVQRTRLITRGRYADLIARRLDTDGFNYNYAIPIAELAGGKTHNYSPIKAAARNLHSWEVEYYDKSRKTWYLSSMINNVILEERDGILRFTCSKWLIDYITDFSNGGYRSYDFETAMAMRNPFAARMYLLTCSQGRKQRWSLGLLRQIMGVEGKYNRLHDFVRRVLEPARAALEQAGCNGFKYDLIRKHPGIKKSPVVAIDITPVKRDLKERNIGTQIAEAKAVVPQLLYDYLLQAWHFSSIEIANNRATLEGFCMLDDWRSKFIEISDRARRKRKNHGYIIQAMKNAIGDVNRG